MNKKKSRFFIVLLAVMLCMAAFSSVAYASDGGKAEPTPTPTVTSTATATPSPEPTIEEGTPLDGEGNLVTRDLLYDKSTNKQFITLETRNGKVFYIVIDYDKPVDEDLEQYHAYFLNIVDERDLLDIIEKDDLPEETAPVATSEPTLTPSPKPTTPPDEEQEPQNNTGGIVAVVLIAVVLAGATVYFFKFRKPKQPVKGKSDLDEYDFGEDADEPDEADNKEHDDAETEDDEP
jgi:flagellar basal body-associated protein FliL